MSEKLLSCPFCGGEAAVCDIKKPSVNGWVGCQRCRCFIDWVKNGKSLAIAAWNRRSKLENEAIVHCAECEHYTPSPMGGNGCLTRFNGRTEIIPRNPTDFCSHGLRKPERSEGQ